MRELAEEDAKILAEIEEEDREADESSQNDETSDDTETEEKNN